MSSKNRAQELQARYGNNVTSTQVNEYIAEVGIRYSTIEKQLKKYKVPTLRDSGTSHLLRHKDKH